MTDVEITLTTRGRTVSDAMSGMSVSRDHPAYAAFTQTELEQMFATFKQFDISGVGFITADDLKEIVTALGLSDVSDAQCRNMIEEVALLTGHTNDGRLSFRDYVALRSYEIEKKSANEALEAIEEHRLSQREEGGADEDETSSDVSEPVAVGDADEAAVAAAAPTAAAATEAEGADTLGALQTTAAEGEAVPRHTRRRGSSFAVLETIAVSRIARFEQVITDAVEQNKKATPPTAEEITQKKFADKLAKFKRIETSAGEAPKVNNEMMHVETLKAKLSAFEEASKKQDPIAFKTSWKNVRQGTWKQKKSIAGGVAPKRSLADLP